MSTYLSDILNQPSSLRKALQGFLLKENTDKMMLVGGLRPRFIVFTGMGSSHYATIGASVYLNQNGCLSMVRSTSQLLHYERALLDREALAVLVSQSGESAEIADD